MEHIENIAAERPMTPEELEALLAINPDAELVMVTDDAEEPAEVPTLN